MIPMIPLLAMTGISIYSVGKMRHHIKKNKGFQQILNDIDTKYQKAVQRKIDSLFGHSRTQQLKELSTEEDTPELSEEEKNVNRRLGVASVNLGLATIVGIFYPPLLVMTIPATVWLSIPRFKSAYISVIKERQVNIAVVDSVLVTSALLSGYLFASVLGTASITISLKLLTKTKDNYQNKLINVFNQHAHFVWILIDDTEVEIPFEKLKVGDIVVVNAGETIAVDGIVIKGVASVDQHSLTGESQPAEKRIGEQVFASTVVLSGKIHVQAEKAGQETVAAQLAKIINHTAEYKTALESRAEQMVDHSSLPTLALSGLAYPIAGASGALAILSSCVGYNMRLLSPMSTLNFLRITSENSILIRDGRVLEKLAEVDTVIFDKTGTLTLDQLQVKKVHSCSELSEEILLTYAAAAEYRQKHPIANAILAEANRWGLTIPTIEDARYEVGYGIKVTLSDLVIRVGSEYFMETENIYVSDEMKIIQENCHTQGYSLVMVAINDTVSGAIELRPLIRPETKQVINLLKKQNISIYILSGDHERPTKALAHELGVTDYFAETLPEQKAKLIKQLQNEGRTICFVGDGINDAIALKQANVSISLRGASTVAIDSAQIILMNENLYNITQLFDLSKKFKDNQRVNMIISVIPGIICISGVFLLHFGIYTSLLLYYVSMALGARNVALPLIEHKKHNLLKNNSTTQ